MSKWIVYAAGVGVMALLGGQAGAAELSDSKVKVTHKAEKPDANGNQKITLTLNVEKGWHLYSNPVGNTDFEENQTSVKATQGGKPIDLKVDYPKGEVIADKTFG